MTIMIKKVATDYDNNKDHDNDSAYIFFYKIIFINTCQNASNHGHWSFLHTVKGKLLLVMIKPKKSPKNFGSRRK